jgi:starch-binding outer membrane protein, SusD/RagB family
MKIASLALLLATVGGACNFDIANPNAPEQIGNNPSRPRVAAAATGLLIIARSDQAAWILKQAIMGREGYRFDTAEPRYVSELISGPLDAGSGFGGGQWGLEYRTIKSGYNLLNVIGTASALTGAEQDGVRGFAHTMIAYSFLTVLEAHTEDSIPIDVNRSLDQPLAPFVTNAVAYAHVASLLDSAQTELNAAGSAFPFELGEGFTGFDQPSTFLAFNRALMARLQAYRASQLGCTACWDSVLIAITAAAPAFGADTSVSLDKGVYFTYSATLPGDAANPLFQDPASAIQVVHPFVTDSVEKKADSTFDNRYLAKVIDRGSSISSGNGLASDKSWNRYPTPSSSVPIIRNEELVLLRAEANLGKANNALAATDINAIRVKSGGLPEIPTLAAQTSAVILSQLFKQRFYSLLYEGHRWVDLRRYNRMNTLQPDRVGDSFFTTLPIPNNEVLARQ